MKYCISVTGKQWQVIKKKLMTNTLSENIHFITFSMHFLLVKISLNGTYYYITDTIGIVLT